MKSKDKKRVIKLISPFRTYGILVIFPWKTLENPHGFFIVNGADVRFLGAT
jgi:hypothetical protein